MKSNTRIDLTPGVRDQACTILNALLADALALASHAKQAHWNVKGPSFASLHALFDEVHGVTAEHVDNLAERVVALGGTAEGTVSIAAEKARVPYYPMGIRGGVEHCNALAEGIAALARTARQAIRQMEEIGDAVSADILTDMVGSLDKYLWMVEAHLDAPQ